MLSLQSDNRSIKHEAAYLIIITKKAQKGTLLMSNIIFNI